MMLARLAENLFWAGRYLERAEHTARVVDVTHTALLEGAPNERSAARGALLAMLSATEAFEERGHELERGPLLEFLVSDREHLGSVASSVAALRENLRSVRELISKELWEASNNLYLDLQGRDLAIELDDRPGDVLTSVRDRCQFITGVIHETLPRDEGWRFLTLGQSLERAGSTARTVAASYERLTAGTGLDFHVWVATLRSASALEAYRRLHRASPDPRHVVAFLLLSDEFPRSTLFSLRDVERNLRKLTSGTENSVVRQAGRLRATVEFVELDTVLEDGLHAWLGQVEHDCNELAELMGPYFFHQAPSGALHTMGA